MGNVVKKIKVLDLFSGAGGLSFGFESSGHFKTEIAVDSNTAALNTLKNNSKNKNLLIINGDITSKEVKNKVIYESKKRNIQLIMGGPPCQGFSMKGKKLGLSDPRNFLFLEFYEIVKNVQPEFILIENVKSLINTADGYFIDEIKKMFSDIGYFISWDILNAKNFGVPQSRERAIIIGSRTKKIDIKNIKTKKTLVTVRDAISDISFLNSGDGEFKTNYFFKTKNKYQEIMRKKSSYLYNHIATNHSELALKKLSLIPPEKGKEFLPKELLGKQKFKTTWSRLEWDKPSPTIDTRFDTPSNGKNSHPVLNRSITPREAARLQSFPDDFIFYGSKTEIGRQIGNAVPPLMAKNIAFFLYKEFMRYNEFSFSKDKSYNVYNEDANKMFDLLKSKNILVDHVITDPPYNISKKNNFNTLKNRKGIDFGDWDKNFDITSWIEKIDDILKPGGSIIIFCSFLFVSDIVNKLKKMNFEVKDLIRWIKLNPMPRNIERRYVSDYELAIWATKKGEKWIFNKGNIKYKTPEYKTPVLLGKERFDHPTQKPLKLMKEIIEIHTNEGDLIFDPFMGTGTTGIAAVKLKRKFIGTEINKKYFNFFFERIE